MRRERQTVWLEDGTEDVLLRLTSQGDYNVLPALCDESKLADLGKAIIDALMLTKAGHDLLLFAEANKPTQTGASV